MFTINVFSDMQNYIFCFSFGVGLVSFLHDHRHILLFFDKEINSIKKHRGTQLMYKESIHDRFPKTEKKKNKSPKFS
jgi:hypothetical protein